MDKKYLVLNIEQEYRTDLENLPWDMPLDKWDDKQIKFLDIMVTLLAPEKSIWKYMKIISTEFHSSA